MVSINGVAQTFSASSIQVNITGQGGTDTAVLHGIGTGQQLVLRPGSADLTGAGYHVHIAAANITADPGKGSGTAAFYGVAGKTDYFYGYPSSATMSDLPNGKWKTYIDRESGYGTVNAYSAAGENDQATLYGNVGDTFNGYATYAQYSHNTVNNFRYVTAYGNSSGRANLYAGSVNDTFSGSPTSATLAGAAFTNQVVGFKEVDAYGITGGKNAAQLTDAAVRFSVPSQPGFGQACQSGSQDRGLRSLGP